MMSLSYTAVLVFHKLSRRSRGERRALYRLNGRMGRDQARHFAELAIGWPYIWRRPAGKSRNADF